MPKSILLFTLLILFNACQPEDDNMGGEPDPDPTPTDLYFPPNNSDTWETTSPEDLNWHTDAIADLLDLVEQNGTRAFIVLKDGKIVIEEYFGQTLLGDAAFDRTKIWYWASAGKTLTAFTVGKAQEDGYLNIEDKTSDHLGLGWTSLDANQEAKITIKNQLTMTSGLDDAAAENGGFLPEDLVFKADAGTRWAYHNAPYTLLDQVVENAVGEDFEPYFNEVLRDKIGMDGSWFWLENNHVFSSTARSMARFGLLVLNNGDWNETAIIDDKDFVEAMITPSQEINKSYGYLWWLNGKESYRLPSTQLEFPGSLVPNAPNDMVAALGKNGQYLSIVPDQNLIVIRMGDNPDEALVPLLFLDDVWERLNDVIQ